MAPSPKKFTRKDIRRPDQFIIFTRDLFHFFRNHRTTVLASSALVIVAILILWGWDLYRGRQNRLAAEEYTRGLALYHNGKYREALEALAQVSKYPASTYSRFGLLYQANSYIALKEPAKAAALLKEFLARERKNPFLRQLAFLTLANTQETAGQCKDASASFREAEKLPGPFKEEALLGQARCSAQNHDFKEALSSYRQYLSNYPGSDRTGEISLRIQEIEALAKEAPRAK